MGSIFKTSIIFICLLTNTLLLVGSTPKKDIDHILVISAYADSNPWSNGFITPIVTMASQDSTIGAYTMNLNMFALQNAKDVDKFEASICEMLPSTPPKIVVFIGNASFVFCDNLNKIWPDIPMLLCGERDYTGPDALSFKPMHLLRATYSYQRFTKDDEPDHAVCQSIYRRESATHETAHSTNEESCLYR